MEGRSLFFMIAPVMIASFIIRPSASYYAAGLASIALLGIAVSEQLTMNYISAAGFFVFAFVSWLTANAYENALRELNIINKELDQRVELRTHELAVANERLTELDKLKSKFVSDVSHELRTPISNIALYLEMLEVGNPSKSKQYLSILKEDISRLTKLVADTLDLSQLEREDTKANFSWHDLNEICRQVFLANKLRAETDGLQFTFMPMEHLPPVWAAGDQIKQVVSNLIGNALNYTHVGDIKIATSVDEDEKHVCIYVNDTGDGIEPEDLKHIFERFYRGRKAGQSTIPGSGLGLAICQEIIEQHNGRIEVDSEVGVGSTFTVFLPIREKKPQEVVRSQL
jgi:signal transduction histidine kinase